MSTEDLVVDLGAALSRFGWKRVDELCSELVEWCGRWTTGRPVDVPKVFSRFAASAVSTAWRDLQGR